MDNRRNLNPDVWMLHLYVSTVRRPGFDARSAGDFEQRRLHFLEALSDSIGGMPQFDMPLEPLIIETAGEDGYSRHPLAAADIAGTYGQREGMTIYVSLGYQGRSATDERDVGCEFSGPVDR
jgi:hypothetical protein